MNTTMKLFLGELNRLIKYMILPISLLVSLLWVGIFLFLSASEALMIAPAFIFMDVALMSVILIGSAYHLEKQEGTVRSMMMMPVSIGQILTAKAIASMVLAIESTIVVVFGLYFIHGIWVDAGLLFLYVIVGSAAHAAIGFALSLMSRDFTALLGYMLGYMLLFAVPSILNIFNLIPATFEWLLYISPSDAASSLISSAIAGSMSTGRIIGSIAYLVVLSAVLFRYIVYPMFKDRAVRGAWG